MAAKRKTTNGKETNGKTLSVLESAMASLARQMEEGQRRTDEKMAELAESQRRTDEKMAKSAAEMAETQRRADERSARNDERTAQVEARIARAEERMARNEELHNELRRHSDELFFEVSKKMDRIEATLELHSKVLDRLPDAIRQQIGFGRQAQP
jgi:hypothetical protein